MSKSKPIPGRPRGRLPLARECWPFILPCLALLLFTLGMSWWIPAGLLAVLLALMLNFFRDPERDAPQEEGLYLAPADGKVVRAEAGKTGARVDIFMNIFDVHVNRSPVSGRLTHMQYFPGRFINASFEKASEHNERNRVEMETDKGEHIAFTQIAGLVARRIVSYVAVGDHILAGQRIGMIRFGSRLDCEIPSGYELLVEKGQKVKAGKTILAQSRPNV